MKPLQLISTHVDASGPMCITLDSGRVRATVYPEAGSKIYDLIDNESGFNVLWHNPRVPLAPTRSGTTFDDTWAGGWDELFPTDVACAHGDNTYPDHGDLWSGPWEWDVVDTADDTATLHLWRYSVCLPCRADKWITVHKDSNELTVDLQLTNVGPHGFHFMFNQHIAHAIGVGSRLHVPATHLAVEPGTPSRAGDVTEVMWPTHEGTGDLSYLPGPEVQVTEFLYPLDLAAGWMAVTHAEPGVAVRIGFDPAVFKTPWFWGVFGGWRGHHLLLTEPCTSRPGSLATAIENGTAAYLAAGESLRTTVTATVTRDFDRDAPGNADPTRRG